MANDMTGVSVHTEAAALDSLLPGLAALRTEANGGAGVCIALLDGPVDRSHPCFNGAAIDEIDTMAENRPSGGFATAHGTHVASILFGQPGSPLSGIAPNSRGLSLPIFSDQSDGTVRAAMQLDLARAIQQAVALGADIINISGGELVVSPEADPYLTNAVRLCAESGVLLIAAAGNDACECLHVPAALGGTLVVGAMDRNGDPLTESNWAAAYARHGVLAPGDDIPGANTPGGGIIRRSGTSFAAAIVSGIAVLLLSAQRRRGITAAPSVIGGAILGGAHPCTSDDDCRRLLGGRLDLEATRTILLKGATKTMNENEHTAEVPADAPGNAAGSAAPEGVMPSCGGETKCGCGGASETKCTCKTEEKPSCAGTGRPALAYVLGRIGYDFATEARRDSFVQGGLRNPHDPRELLGYLQKNPWAAADVTFTLEQDSTPIYAVQGGGPFAEHVYERLREFLADHLDGTAETVSLPSWVGGNTTLTSGQRVPVLWPNPRGMYSWNRTALLDAVVGNASDRDERTAAIGNFLDRVSYELRNLGIDPRERALNYAATNAFQVARVYESAIAESLTLDGINVDRSPICRPHSDCWDVSLTFFDPLQRLTRSRRVYRFTVDVSDVIPVTVGSVRHWDTY